MLKYSGMEVSDEEAVKRLYNDAPKWEAWKTRGRPVGTR